MKNDAFRTAGSKLLVAGFIAASTLLMSSCGGGGAAGNPGQGGTLFLQPNPGTAYAGIPFPLTIAGGRAPYTLGSSEPSIFPVPAVSESSIITVLPQQPGVVDTGLDAGEVPRRSVTVSARDVNGQQATTLLSVLQNFLTGYGVSYVSQCPSAGAATPGATASAVQACPGRESAIIMSPTFNGQRRGNALVRFERLRGNFGFTQCGSPPPVNVAVLNSITQNTDHNGIAQVCIFVPLDAATQINAYRIIDVATGVYSDQIFLTDGNALPGALTTIPDTITFTGTNGRCGTGSADFLVTGGAPPYTATSTNGTVAVTPSTSTTQPGRFTVTLAIQGPPCPAAVQVVVRDSLGAIGTVTVDSVQGPAAPALVVAPSTFTLQCGQSGTAVVVGGSGSYSAFSSNGAVSATVAGNQVQITRVGNAAPVQPTPLVSTVNITDGTSIATITVNSPTTCP